jgi:hypothetical protein
VAGVEDEPRRPRRVPPARIARSANVLAGREMTGGTRLTDRGRADKLSARFRPGATDPA